MPNKLTALEDYGDGKKGGGSGPCVFNFRNKERRKIWQLLVLSARVPTAFSSFRIREAHGSWKCRPYGRSLCLDLSGKSGRNEEGGKVSCMAFCLGIVRLWDESLWEVIYI